MRILGIESTCDETGVAVVENGRRVLSNVVASSVELHKKYGGVVPEVAAREQVRVIIPVVQEALTQAFGPIGTKNSRKFGYPIDAIAVAHGPGLIGSLLIGVETAKTLAIAWNKPLIAVNHLVGHIYANWLAPDVNSKLKIRERIFLRKRVNGKEKSSIYHLPLTIDFLLVALIVSGGHTDLVLMIDHGKYKLLGSTLDDAAGEVFDKVARVLGLGYPGGPEIERVASRWSLVTSNQKLETSCHLPRPMINSKSLDFSFSGLKTAVVNLVSQVSDVKGQMSAIAMEFQKAVVDVLVTKTINAAKKYRVKSIVVGGGVAANELLRSEFIVHSKRLGIEIIFPSKEFSVDNGTMIAAAAFYNFKKIDPLRLSANPGLHF